MFEVSVVAVAAVVEFAISGGFMTLMWLGEMSDEASDDISIDGILAEGTAIDGEAVEGKLADGKAVVDGVAVDDEDDIAGDGVDINGVADDGVDVDGDVFGVDGVAATVDVVVVVCAIDEVVAGSAVAGTSVEGVPCAFDGNVVGFAVGGVSTGIAGAVGFDVIGVNAGAPRGVTIGFVIVTVAVFVPSADEPGDIKRKHKKR